MLHFGDGVGENVQVLELLWLLMVAVAFSVVYERLLFMNPFD